MQLELFPTLPVLSPLPRRLREYGFQLKQLERYIASLSAYRRTLDKCETQVADIVAEAKAVGHVMPRAYSVVVEAEETRELTDEALRKADEVFRELECQLDAGINKHLMRRKG
jgi:hypothetical protein